MDSGKELTRREIISLLKELGNILATQGLESRIYLVGLFKYAEIVGLDLAEPTTPAQRKQNLADWIIQGKAN